MLKQGHTPLFYIAVTRFLNMPCMGDGWRTSGVQQRYSFINTMIPMEVHGWVHACEKKLFLSGKEHHVMEFWVGLYP